MNKLNINLGILLSIINYKIILNKKHFFKDKF